MTTLPERLRSPRGWLVGIVIALCASAWIAVGFASTNYLLYSRQLGVAGIALVVGCIEVTYLISTAWMHGEKLFAGAAATLASAGAVMVWAATGGGVTGSDFVMIASGVGMVGFANGVGLMGVFRSKARSTASSVTALVIICFIAYFASLMWSTVP